MKQPLWIVAAIITMSMMSCSKDDTLKSADNYLTAKRNNINWAGVAEMHMNADTLLILGIANRPNDEVLEMKIKFNGPGSYSLTNNQGYYYSTVGGDVVVSEYRLASDTEGQLVISKYLPAEKIIEGNFQMELKKIRSNTTIDSYSFTQGAFKGKIIN